MQKNLLVAAILSFVAVASTGGRLPAQTILVQGFGDLKDGPGLIHNLPDHGSVLEITATDPGSSAMRVLRMPLERIRGNLILVNCDISADNVSARPRAWNGIKVMAHIKSPQSETWPQSDLPVDTFDWRHVFLRFQVPENATAVTFSLGLEKVTGTVRFSKLTITLGPKFVQAPPAPANQPIFVGHDLPRLRGAMVATTLTKEDLKYFKQEWNGNLIRWQLIQTSISSADPDFTAYDKWLDELLTKTDLVLGWAKKLNIKVVLDLHSPPGGKYSAGGYTSAEGPIFTNPRAQAHFLEVWQKLAKRYKGDKTIWGFDLVNEPIDDATTPECMDWQELSLAAGKAVQLIDPDRTLIIEPPNAGGPAGFLHFNPVPLKHVVYSFHMYEPGAYTSQDVFKSDGGLVYYPSKINGTYWDRWTLDAAMKPASDFAKRYRVHLYVGEFSVIRWAPNAKQYLSDVISLFEEHGWDWSYHAFREWDGWSLEHGTNMQDHVPSVTPTARFQAVEMWMKLNNKEAD